MAASCVQTIAREKLNYLCIEYFVIVCEFERKHKKRRESKQTVDQIDGTASKKYIAVFLVHDKSHYHTDARL